MSSQEKLDDHDETNHDNIFNAALSGAFANSELAICTGCGYTARLAESDLTSDVLEDPREPDVLPTFAAIARMFTQKILSAPGGNTGSDVEGRQVASDSAAWDRVVCTRNIRLSGQWSAIHLRPSDIRREASESCCWSSVKFSFSADVVTGGPSEASCRESQLLTDDAVRTDEEDILPSGTSGIDCEDSLYNVEAPRKTSLPITFGKNQPGLASQSYRQTLRDMRLGPYALVSIAELSPKWASSEGAWRRTRALDYLHGHSGKMSDNFNR